MNLRQFLIFLILALLVSACSQRDFLLNEAPVVLEKMQNSISIKRYKVSVFGDSVDRADLKVFQIAEDYCFGRGRFTVKLSERPTGIYKVFSFVCTDEPSRSFSFY